MSAMHNITVKDITLSNPDSYRVFHKYGIDFCCGGKRLLTDVCSEKGISVDDVLKDIEASNNNKDNQTNWIQKSQQELIMHIIAEHHDFLRNELPRIRFLLAKVANRHGPTHPHLFEVQDIFEKMSHDLLQHIEAEERTVFPMIKNRDISPNVSLSILMMETEHIETGEALEKLIKLTDAYKIKNGMCASYQALYTGLADLDANIRVHMHKENDILFSRALSSMPHSKEHFHG